MTSQSTLNKIMEIIRRSETNPDKKNQMIILIERKITKLEG